MRKGASGGCSTSVPVWLPRQSTPGFRALCGQGLGPDVAPGSAQKLRGEPVRGGFDNPKPLGWTLLFAVSPTSWECLYPQKGRASYPPRFPPWCGDRKLGMMAALPSGRTWGLLGGSWKGQGLELQVLKTLLPSITRGRGRRQLLRAQAPPPPTGDPHFQRDLVITQYLNLDPRHCCTFHPEKWVHTCTCVCTHTHSKVHVG